MTRELTGSMCSRAFSILLLCIIGLPLSAPGQTNQTSREGQLDLVGFPLLSFTSDRGTGYGAYVAGFWRAEQGARVPYKASVGGQFYETTGGYAFHKFLVDIPNLLDSESDWSSTPATSFGTALGILALATIYRGFLLRM